MSVRLSDIVANCSNRNKKIRENDTKIKYVSYNNRMHAIKRP